jgi:L-threonylcarbamoyladenylate synthase
MVRDTNGVKGLVSELLTADVARAAEAIRAGGMVGMPTETVYGLAADAENAAAVARVFAVKGRPADHPLIVHVSGAGQLDSWARDVPPYARRLAEALWPGPLTLVLPRSARAGDHVTGGQDTVGLRAPSHPVAQQLLAAVGGGLAAPSANRFGRVSPTTAAHVLAELGGLLDPERDVVLDGGHSTVGVESAILDCTGAEPLLLRPGAVDAAEVARVGGVPLGSRASAVRAPGTLTSHYAPAARVLIAPDGAQAARLLAPLDGLLALAEVATPEGVVRLSAPADAAGYARVLYAALREADALGLARVIAVPPAPAGIGLAVADRLARAAAAGTADAARHE